MSTRMLLSLALFVCSPSVALSQNFSGFDDFLRQLEAATPESRTALADSFVRWQLERQGFPIQEGDGSVVFFFRGGGDAHDVRVTGDFRPGGRFNVYWDSVGHRMMRVGPIYYHRQKFEPDARLDYKFIVDGRSTIDSLNPRRLISGVGGGEASELMMQGYRAGTFNVQRENIPRGTLRVLEEAWATPKVTIYFPPGYEASTDYPTLYTADGSAWVELIRLPIILDNLIADRAIEPVIAVMIDAASDRRTWYYYNPEYLAYLGRVVAYVDSAYSTRKRAQARVHAGTSAGGRAALYAGLELPDLFGNVGMLSPALDGPVHYFEPYFSETKRPERGLAVWLSAGTYEGSIHADAKTIEAYFRKTGQRTRAVYLNQGHSFGAWRDVAPDMLSYFFGAKK